MINLINKDHEVKLNVNLAFRYKNNSSDECNFFIKTKSANADKTLDELIKKQETLEKASLFLKDVESIIYSFTKIIIKKNFVESADWIKNKKCMITPQNKDSKCFRYSVIISLYHKETKNNPKRISKVKPFINNLNWKNINFSLEEQDFETLEMNNKSIALNTLQVNEKNKPSFISLNLIK